MQDLTRIIRRAAFPQGRQAVDEMRGLAESIVARKRALFGARYGQDYLQRSIDRSFRQPPLRAAMNTLQADDAAQTKEELLQYLVFVLNNVAGLQNKQPLRLALIGSDKEKTAGDQLFGFGGFFDRQWREYDYRLGREEAHRLLPTILGAAYDPERTPDGRLHVDYHLPDAWRERFPNVRLRDVDRQQKQRFLAVVLERADGVLREFKVGRLARWAIKKFVLKKQLRRLLEF